VLLAHQGLKETREMLVNLELKERLAFKEILELMELKGLKD
jgi:hypothetical protein